LINSTIGFTVAPTLNERPTLPKPNYQFEKRKRDLEKQAKKKEKAARKAEAKNAPASSDNPEPPAP
jgi:hypothetical protein